MIEYKKGNIFESGAEAIVNTVNCVGVMGRGLALQCKVLYPKNYEAYRSACDAGEVRIGKMFVCDMQRQTNPKYIINFPTKRHWRFPSKMEYITKGLSDLAGTIRRIGVKSVAIPPLGCGLGGLDWNKVRQLIEIAVWDLPEVNVAIYDEQFLNY